MRERLRWTLAAAVLAGLGLALAAPLTLAFGPEEGWACSRGRCCCPGDRTDGGLCVRAACTCGGDRVATMPTLDEGLLPAPVDVSGDDDAGPVATALRSLPPAPDLAPPAHPPPSSRSTR